MSNISRPIKHPTKPPKIRVLRPSISITTIAINGPTTLEAPMMRVPKADENMGPTVLNTLRYIWEAKKMTELMPVNC